MSKVQTVNMEIDDRIRFLTDLSAAHWLGRRMHTFGHHCTGSLMPEGFDAYCRVFHPIQPHYPDPEMLTWSELAAQNGRIAHPGMQLHMINRPVGTPGSDNYVCDDGPAWGWLPVSVRSTLIEVLKRHTSTPDRCWFCVWGGSGDLDSVPSQLVRLGDRDYALYSGSIDLALAPLDDHFTTSSPDLWWPNDRSWIVGTDMDDAWSYVGGSVMLIQELVATKGLEAMEVRLDDDHSFDSDLVNAALDSDQG